MANANDIFGRETVGYKGGFNSAAAKLLFGDNDLDSGLLVAQIQVQYNQPISRIYEVAGDGAYFVIGRPTGNGSFGTVIGPKSTVTTEFYKRLSDPCNPPSINLEYNGAGCNLGGSPSNNFTTAKRRINNIMVESIGFQINAQDMLINENLGFQFAYLSE